MKNLLRRAVPALTFAPFSAQVAPAIPGPLEDGLAAYKARQYRQAASLLLPLAEAGDTAAQIGVGSPYSFDHPAPWATPGRRGTARRGIRGAEGRFLPGGIHASGKGVAKDYARALAW